MKMKNFAFLFTIIFSILSTCSLHSQSDRKLATAAKSHINKSDAFRKDLDKSMAFEAIRKCAHKAGVIAPSEMSQVTKMQFEINNKLKDVLDLKKVIPGKLLGFFKNGNLSHTMIAIGNGEAIGTQNLSGIGCRNNHSWQQVPVSDLLITHKTDRNIPKGVFVNRAKNIKFSIKELSMADLVKNSNSGLTANLKWHSMTAYENANKEYMKHLKDFKYPNVKDLNDFVNLANEIINNKSNDVVRKHMNGELYLFDRKKGVFVVANVQGLPMEMFKPKDGIEYFNKITKMKKYDIDQLSPAYDLIPLGNQYDVVEKTQPRSNGYDTGPLDSQSNPRGNVYDTGPLDDEPSQNYDAVPSGQQAPNGGYDAVPNGQVAPNGAYDIVPNAQQAPNNGNVPNTQGSNGYETVPQGSASRGTGITSNKKFHEDYSKVRNVKTGDWASDDRGNGAKNARLKYNKNKSKFKRGITLIQYISVAHNFYHNPPPGTLRKNLSNGDVVFYHSGSNLLGVFDGQGNPVDLSRPNNGVTAYDNY